MLLRYLWSNLLFGGVIPSTFKVFIIPIYLYTKACVKNKLLALNCQEINQYVSCVRSFTSREGVVGFYPIFGQRLPTLMSLRSPTQTLGCQCGFTGSTGPVTTTRINLTSLWTVGDFSVFDYTRLKACQLADLAPTSNPSGRRKKEWSVNSVDQFDSFRWCSFNFWCQFSDVIFPCIVSFIWRLRRHQFWNV